MTQNQYMHSKNKTHKKQRNRGFIAVLHLKVIERPCTVFQLECQCRRVLVV